MKFSLIVLTWMISLVEPAEETTLEQGKAAILDGMEDQFPGITEAEINQILGYEEDDVKYDNENDRRSVDAYSRLWPKLNGKLHIPYEISVLFTSRDAARITGYIRIMNSHIKCNQDTWKLKIPADEHYVRFVPGKGCSSVLGRYYEKEDSYNKHYQTIELAQPCIYFNRGTVLHEMLHTMGFAHEHARPDRDRYVSILYDNMDPRAIPNFWKRKSMIKESTYFPYDYGSIMHYGRKAFSHMGKDTIVPKKAGVSIGQRNGLSLKDIGEVNVVYGCMIPPPTTTTTTTTTTAITTTKTTAATTPSMTNITGPGSIFNCGFGTSTCDVNTENKLRLKYKQFTMVKSVNCVDKTKSCEIYGRYNLCKSRSLGEDIRTLCPKTCSACITTQEPYFTTKRYGYIRIYVKSQYLQSLNVCPKASASEKKKSAKYCLEVRYRRTSYHAPKIVLLLYSVSKGALNRYKYTRNYLLQPKIGLEGIIKETVSMTCTSGADDYSFVNIAPSRRRSVSGELQIKGVSLKTGNC